VSEIRSASASDESSFISTAESALAGIAALVPVGSAPELSHSWFAKVVVMSERSTEQIRELLDSLYRVDSGRILATLIRLLGCLKNRQRTRYSCWE